MRDTETQRNGETEPHRKSEGLERHVSFFSVCPCDSVRTRYFVGSVKNEKVQSQDFEDVPA